MHSRKARLLAGIGAAAAAALILGGCAGTKAVGTAGSNAEQPHKGGDLTVQISQDPGSLDPIASGNKTTGTISRYLFEKLFDLDGDNRPQPVLAKKSTVSDDGLRYTFTLRDGLKFSDGTPLTSADVLASLQRWITYSNPGKTVGDLTESLTAPDDHTIVMQLTKRWPIPLVIASGDGAIVLKKHTAETAGAKGFDTDDAIGSGAYKLGKWVPGQKITLVRNDEYTSPGGAPSGRAGARHAYLDSITFTVVKDEDAAINGLKTGQWDVITTPSPNHYKDLKAASGIRVSTLFGGNSSVVFFNTHEGTSIFAKQKARDAMNLLLDKKAIAASTGTPDLTSRTSAWAAEKNANLHSTAGDAIWSRHDPKKGERLLEEAGYKAGDTLNIITTSEFPEFTTWATVIQDQLRKEGITAKVQSYDFSTMIDKAKAFQFDMMVLFDDNDFVLPQQSIVVNGLLPILGVDPIPAETQKLNHEFTVATSDKKAHEIADRIEEHRWTTKPSLTFAQNKSYIAYSSKLKGYDGYRFDFWNCWLGK